MTLNNRIILTLAILATFAGTLQAQNDCLRRQFHGLESPTQTHPTVWVCTGDTLSVNVSESGDTITTIDGFWITCHEVTRDLWKWYYHINRNAEPGDLLPITGVSSVQIDSFLTMLNLSLGQKWRLPTRDEWLFAFKGGIFSEGYRYAGSNHPDWVAWSKANSGGRLHAGGERVANELGICDMSGNAAEMVTQGGRDLPGPAIQGDTIILMGGCYLDDLKPLRNNTIQTSTVCYPVPPQEAQGFRIIFRESLKFNKHCERVF